MFDRERFRTSSDDYAARMAWSDDVLYRMCRGAPRHACLDRVHGKLSLIGRSYATGLERLLKGRDDQSGNLRRWCEYFRCNAVALDGLVTRVRRVRAPLSVEKLRAVACVHGRLVQLLRRHPHFRRSRKTGSKFSPTSFASKYLHFHNPVVPIYDSWAAAGARRVARLRNCDDALERKAPRRVDKDYWQFLRRFWCVYRDARKALRRSPSVRYLDRYFLHVEDKARAAKASR